MKELQLYCIPLKPALFLAIATLPKLKILEFTHSDFLEDKWDVSEDIYRSLKTLRLANGFLIEWQVDTETFPKLVELIVEHCHELTQIPSVFGDIDTLKFIRVVKNNRHLGNLVIEIKKDVKTYTGEELLDVHVTDVCYSLGPNISDLLFYFSSHKKNDTFI